MKIYYPNVLNSTVEVLPFAPKVARVLTVANLDQGGANNPLAVLRARWAQLPAQLQQKPKPC